MENLFQRKFIKFFIVAALYLLVVIWIGNFWLLIGLAIIYDMYVSGKVNWTFWMRRDGKKQLFYRMA